jgi:glutamate synthase (NADPH/NADH) large chain
VAINHKRKQDHGLETALDHKLIAAAKAALETASRCGSKRRRNVNRTVGAMLSGEVAKRHGHAGLPEDTISVRSPARRGRASAPSWRAAFRSNLIGDANDYVGKGLSGGRVIVASRPRGSRAIRSENIIVGNTVLYGAIAAKPISTAWPASVSRCAIPAPSRSWKAPATMAANT